METSTCNRLEVLEFHFSSGRPDQVLSTLRHTCVRHDAVTHSTTIMALKQHVTSQKHKRLGRVSPLPPKPPAAPHSMQGLLCILMRATVELKLHSQACIHSH